MQTKIISINESAGGSCVQISVRVNDINVAEQGFKPVQINLNIIISCSAFPDFVNNETHVMIDKVEFKRTEDFRDIKFFLDKNIKTLLYWDELLPQIRESYFEAFKRKSKYINDKMGAAAIIELVRALIMNIKKEKVSILDKHFGVFNGKVYCYESESERLAKEGIFYRCVYDVDNINPVGLSGHRKEIDGANKYASYYDVMKLYSIKEYVFQKSISELLDISKS